MSNKTRKHPEWFRKTKATKDIVYMKYIRGNISNNPKRRIVSWIYDSELGVYIIKRYDGNQYLNRTRAAFNSVPLIELRELAKLELINHRNDGLGNVMAIWLRKEVLSGNYENLNPNNVGKYVEFKEVINTINNRPFGRVVYKPIETIEYVPCKRLPQDILGDLSVWYIDDKTGEMCFEDRKFNIIMKLYDSLHLVNFSKKDLMILKKKKPLCSKLWRLEADCYERVVRVCLNYAIYAGSRYTRKKDKERRKIFSPLK